MRLTSYSNFSLRTLMVAAMRAPKLSTVQQVADAFGISRAHLVKCVHQLGQWGYLENLRGNHGGFRLARPAAEITIGEIVRRTEEGFDLVECFSPETASCPLVGRCRLSTALAKITRDPARTAGLTAGTLAPGAGADVVLFDPNARWTVNGAALASQGKHTPFLGYELTGQVKATIVAGHVAFER